MAPVPMTDHPDLAAAGDTDERDTEGGDDVARRGHSWGRLVVVAIVFCWLGGAIGWSIAQEPDTVEAGAVDTGFSLDMIAHHEQAVEMALVQLGNDGDPTIAGFAREIVIFQQYEIGRMDEVLRDAGVSRDDRGPTAMAWMGMAVPVEDMPGLASAAELEELRAATGPAADALFLELMADHHRGGVHMAAYAAANATDPGVRALATRMERNQSIEINEYGQTAERLGLDVDIEPITVDHEHGADDPG